MSLLLSSEARNPRGVEWSQEDCLGNPPQPHAFWDPKDSASASHHGSAHPQSDLAQVYPGVALVTSPKSPSHTPGKRAVSPVDSDVPSTVAANGHEKQMLAAPAPQGSRAQPLRRCGALQLNIKRCTGLSGGCAGDLPGQEVAESQWSHCDFTVQ